MEFMLFNRMLFLVSFWNALYAQNKVEIERRVMIYNTSASRWMYQPDTFKLPSGTCKGDGSAQCRSMGSQTLGSCTCECTTERATFGFYDDQWKCIANSRARKYGASIDRERGPYLSCGPTKFFPLPYGQKKVENTRFHSLCMERASQVIKIFMRWRGEHIGNKDGGCSLILLRNRTKDSPIVTVPKSVQSNIPFEMSTNLQRCYIIPYKSAYLKCDETWETLDNNFVFDRFSTKGNNQAQYFVFKKPRPDLHYEVKEGSVMRMAIGCYNKSNAIIPNCLRLKMQGAIECPNFTMPPSLKPTTVTPMPIPPIKSATTTTTTATTTTATAAAATPPPTPKPISTKMPHPNSNSSVPSSTPRKITNARHSQSTTVTSPSSFGKGNKGATREGSNIDLIAGATAGMIGLILIIVAVVIIIRRRQKRNAAVARSTKIIENASYERGVDKSLRITNQGQQPLDNDENSYAYANSVVVDRRNGHPNDQEPQTTVTNHVYGKVESLDRHGSPTFEDTVSNTIEPPEYAKVDMSKMKTKPASSDGPIYNTLEEPYYAKGVDPKTLDNQDGHLYSILEGPESGEGREPPYYHVLEGPFPGGTPLYNVLEGPKSTEVPAYRTHGGQDLRVYGTLGPRDDPKGAVNSGYNDTVYDSVGDVISDTGDIYQQLNQNGQRNLDVYQALNHQDDALCLNELPSHSTT